jgi:hypothetical protein
MSSYVVVAAASRALRRILREAFDADAVIRPIAGSESAVGDVVRNLTDGSRGRITAATSTAVAADASTGGANSFAPDDSYLLTRGLYLHVEAIGVVHGGTVYSCGDGAAVEAASGWPSCII